MDRAYASRACLRQDRNRFWSLSTKVAIRFNENYASLLQCRSLAYRREKLPTCPKDLSKAVALNRNFIGVIRNNQGIVSTKNRYRHLIMRLSLLCHQSIAYLNRGIMLLRAKNAIRPFNP